MNKIQIILLSYMAAASLGWSTIDVTTTKTAKGGTVPTVSGSDLGETAASNISATFGTGSTGGNTTVDAEPLQLFNGQIGNDDGDTDDPGETVIGDGGSVTIDFDVTTNTLGYDITGIDTYAGWKTVSGGRSNQGYGIKLTFMDDSTATLVDATHWEPNTSPTEYWTEVSFVNNGGGALSSDFVNLNGGGNVAGNGIVASGVKSMTFDGFFEANPGNFNVYREIDIFGAATVPEPSSAALLLGLAGLATVFIRRRR